MIQEAADACIEFLVGVFTEAWEIIKEAWDAAVDFFKGIWEGIKKAFAAVKNFFGEIFSEAWERGELF